MPSNGLSGSAVVRSKNFAYSGDVPRVLVVHPDWTPCERTQEQVAFTQRQDAITIVSFLRNTFSDGVLREVKDLMQ